MVLKSKKSLFVLLVLLFCGNFAFSADYESISPTKKASRDDGKAVVIIRSNASDASVYLNGSLYGKTDLTITSLAPGYYKLKIEKDGYEPRYVQIQARRDYTLTYTVNLERLVGYVDFSGLTSDSLVYIGGARKTSFPVEMPVGDYQVRVRRFGYEDFYKSVTVYKRKTAVVTPKYYVAPFEISDFSISKKVINPDYSNGFGRTEISFEVTNTGHAELYVTDAYDNVVWYTNWNSFSTWEQSCTWKGTNNSGDVVPDGEYRIILTDNEAFTEEGIVKVDRTVSFPLVNYTKSGSGIGSLPAAFRLTQNFVVPFMYVTPEMQFGNSKSGYYNTAIGGGLYMDLFNHLEFGIAGEGYIGLDVEGSGWGFNTNMKYSFSSEVSSGEYLCIGALVRYGLSGVNTYAPYGIDTGNGIGLGGVIGFDSNKSYTGFSSEFIWGAPNGALANGYGKCSVWKNGVVVTGKLSKSFSVSAWAALHSCFGLYNEDGTITEGTLWTRGKEAGVEISGVPGSSSLIMSLKIKALMIEKENPYVSAQFGLSYLF
ncbi:MAG: PEGA domain-containing protein [Treponema sp.]|nr:PEGA domain-containing protein [Treponema sp.]